MRKFSLIIGFLACPCFAFEAQANQKKTSEFIGAYGGVGTNFQTSGSFNIGFKLRYLSYCPFGLEFVDTVPYGTEIAFPLYLAHHKNFKFHIIIPFTGFHIPWWKKRMAVDWVVRKDDGIDFVLGLGAEYQFKTKGALADFGFNYISVGIDWRMIVPSPVWVFSNWGDLGRDIYKQAAEEGQIWLGVTFWR